jgi:hypothetical protein
MFPIIIRQLSKPEDPREAGLGFTLRYGRARPVCRFISPETQDPRRRQSAIRDLLGCGCYTAQEIELISRAVRVVPTACNRYPA